MNTKRSFHGLGLVGDNIYAVGGWDDSRNRLNVVERYNTANDEWTIVRPMNEERFGLAVATLNVIIFFLLLFLFYSELFDMIIHVKKQNIFLYFFYS